MLEQLFSSKTRVQILTLFMRNPDKVFYVRELARLTNQYINSIRRELDNLQKLGLLKFKHSGAKLKKKFYFIDQSFFLFEEIRRLFLKAKVFLENDLTNALKKSGEMKLVVFTGSFTGAPTETDLLIVGDKIKLDELRSVLENFTLTLGHEIKYTVFDTAEYNYRKDISDHFLMKILENRNIILVDKL
jgi:DNA-binding MarR family transcriptional regulator